MDSRGQAIVSELEYLALGVAVRTPPALRARVPRRPKAKRPKLTPERLKALHTRAS